MKAAVAGEHISKEARVVASNWTDQIEVAIKLGIIFSFFFFFFFPSANQNPIRLIIGSRIFAWAPK